MLRNTNELKGMTIHATDGKLGTASEFYFDDEAWTIRYLTVDTGGWLSGRAVLISPYSILRMDMEARRLDVALTKKQVEGSPSIDTQKPVSRQHEASYLNYYGYPYYWGGSVGARILPFRVGCSDAESKDGGTVDGFPSAQ
jgi:hypothetical protein